MASAPFRPERRGAHFPALRQRAEEQVRGERMAAEMERGHRLAERRVGGLQHMVHLGREARGNVPVVGLGEHMVAAFEPDAAVAERLVGLDVERGPHLRACRLHRVAHALGDYPRGIRESVIAAPALERQRRAVMGERSALRLSISASASSRPTKLSGQGGARRRTRRAASPSRGARPPARSRKRCRFHICSTSADNSNHASSWRSAPARVRRASPPVRRL